MKEAVKAKRAPRKEKVQKVELIKGMFDKSKIVVLTESAGLTVEQVTNLRKKLRKANAEFRIYKNTLTNIALQGGELKDLGPMLIGPNAFLFGFDDPVAPVKILADFIKENEKPSIKAGLLGKQLLDTASVNALAKLPSREILLAKVFGGMKSPISGLVNVLQGTIRKFVYTLVAIKEKKPQA